MNIIGRGVMKNRLKFIFKSDYDFPGIIDVKRHILEKVFLIYLILIIPGMAMSLSRGLQLGWQPVLFAQLTMHVMSFVLFLFRKKLSIYVYLGAFLMILFTLGYLAIITFSLSGAYLFILLAICLFSIFFNYRASIVLLIISSAAIAAIGAMQSLGIIVRTVDFNAYNFSILGWLNVLSIYIFTAFILLSSVDQQNKYLLKLFQDNEQTNKRISDTNSELKKSEIRLRQVFENIPSVVYKRDYKNNNYEYVSPAIEKISGFTVDEFLALGIQGVNELVHPDDLNEIFATIKEIYLKGGGSVYIEFRFKGKDGIYRWVGDGAYYYTDTNGLPDYTIGNIQDINERKQAEEMLNKRESYLSAIIENQPGLLWLKDAEGRFLAVNRSFAKSCGLSKPEDVVNKTDNNIWPSELAEKYRADDASVIANRKPTVVEEPIADRGQTRWFETFKTPIFNDKGEVIGTTGYARDITERRQADEVLRMERQRLDSIIKGTNVGTWEWNVQTGDIIINQRWAQIVGYTLDELSPISIETWEGLADPDDFKASKERLSRHFEGETDYYESEARMRHKEGRWVWILDRGKVSIWTPDGKPLMMQGTHQDITERKHAEQTIAAKNKELEQIVYVTSHDLRSPLVNVDGYGRELEYSVAEIIQILEKDRDNAIKLGNSIQAVLPDVTDALKHIRNSTRQMDTLLKGLLKLSRSGRVALVVRPLDMNKLLAEIAVSVGFQIKIRNVELQIGDVPPCLGDEMQVSQVFSNLIGNALKYLDSSRAGSIRVNGSLEFGRSVYCVEDNGIGIASEHQEKIFELFHRLNPVGSEGEGLGLTIVRQILSRLDGSIRVESKIGEGSRFYVTLPYAELNKEEEPESLG